MSYISNSQLPIPNYQFPIPNYQLPIPNSQFPIPNSQKTTIQLPKAIIHSRQRLNELDR
ncbi:MAG: hypothetical protein F6K41_36755 [Symploca sp. SIO3E6]|nr:hypothetical protein [Caldora sp. SIO3E6]